MSNVLVPIDSSDNAMRALQHAIGAAKQNPCIEIHIVHAHEPPVMYGRIAAYFPIEKGCVNFSAFAAKTSSTPQPSWLRQPV